MYIDIEKRIVDIIKSLFDNPVEINLETPLIGGSSPLDSMQLVQLCIMLEDLSNEYQFTFDWTSDVVMSKSKSIFRNVSSLVQEFYNQMESNKV